MRRLSAIVGAAVLLAAAGCARPAPPTASAPATHAAPGAGAAAFEQRAADVIAAWSRSGAAGAWHHGFVPLQDLTVLAADPGFTEDTKIAFGYGWYTLGAPLPSATPASGQVRYPDGTATKVPLVSAAAAYRQLDQGDPPCPAATPAPAPSDSGPDGVTSGSPTLPCVSLKVTSARLGSVELRTSRGLAIVPAWLFTVAGLTAPVARVAVAASAVSAPPDPAATWPMLGGLVAAQDLVEVDGRTVRFRLGVGSCDTDITPLVYETAGAVALAGSVHTPGGVCDNMLRLEPVTVTLAAPLGDRVILDGLNGTPLAMGSR